MPGIVAGAACGIGGPLSPAHPPFFHWPCSPCGTTPVPVPCTAVLQKYRDAAMVELEALNTLAANDPSQDLHCVQVRVGAAGAGGGAGRIASCGSGPGGAAAESPARP